MADARKFTSLTKLKNPENSSSALKDEGREPAAIHNGSEGPGEAKGRTRGAGPGRPTGKRSDPDYEQTTVFLKRDTKRTAIRGLEDSGQKPDLSDLLQSLLEKHNSARA